MSILALHKQTERRLAKEGWVKLGTVIETDPKSEKFGGLWVKDGQKQYVNFYTLNGLKVAA